MFFFLFVYANIKTTLHLIV